jgi:hypothetical protein
VKRLFAFSEAGHHEADEQDNLRNVFAEKSPRRAAEPDPLAVQIGNLQPE